MQELLGAIESVGFPIVVTGYLLVRIEGRLASLDRSIQQLSQAIAKMQS